jgi:hypothetical protein
MITARALDARAPSEMGAESVTVNDVRMSPAFTVLSN